MLSEGHSESQEVIFLRGLRNTNHNRISISLQRETSGCKVLVIFQIKSGTIEFLLALINLDTVGNCPSVLLFGAKLFVSAPTGVFLFF